MQQKDNYDDLNYDAFYAFVRAIIIQKYIKPEENF